ncbi:hypothetical protein BN940_01656 [Castellaniella defragrans 65Phen]|uniref:Uncharacterized protein n=1 Tax=Castellaniella defragrans (strain DSM 12143 / CCUG 39792 / 65Phen) TaxID=1437824 RepID=W8WSY9_CASD6|nr:hypothetical protein BN940_01656 [Castellaniella defragrans 65Phen]
MFPRPGSPGSGWIRPKPAAAPGRGTGGGVPPSISRKPTHEPLA